VWIDGQIWEGSVLSIVPVARNSSNHQ
jgi:hypothetical protein